MQASIMSIDDLMPTLGKKMQKKFIKASEEKKKRNQRGGTQDILTLNNERKMINSYSEFLQNRVNVNLAEEMNNE